MGGAAVYVETTIRAPIERVWELTQNPELHARWDLRFSRIEPLIGTLESGGYRFRYERRLPFHTIVGSGTSLGDREAADGTRTSALRFDTGDRLSPLGAGRGYWRYTPVDGGTRFVTGFDYEPGWGATLDRLVMRSLVGWMTRIRRGPWWTVPFLRFGRLRNILVADIGTDVPFVIENYPYRDPFGRETITFVREYRTRPDRPARFDATMILDRGRVVDYLGTHQHLVVDLALRAEADGSLRLASGAQRFYEGPIGFRFPMIASGYATLVESYDDEAECFRVRLEVRNRLVGFLFGYEGSFTCEFVPATDAPPRLKPRRHELRT